MTLGEATGVIGQLRAWLMDRPHVKAIPVFNDYGTRQRGIVTTRVGRVARIEVHCTGRAPVRVTWIGFELTNGSSIELEVGDRLPAVLSRPAVCERWIERDSLAARLQADGPKVRLRRVRVNVSPDHTFRSGLPKGWGGFPTEDPPASPPDAGGPTDFAAWV
jgi:hypothetical protein